MKNTNTRWKIRPEGSTWGDFGPDDQLGRLNLVTREKLLEGIAEVREGIAFCLSLPLTLPGGSVLNPRRKPPRWSPLNRRGRPAINYPASLEDSRYTDLICDDTVELDMQYSTQWDSLAHIGQLFDVDGDGRAERVYYNGFRAGIDIVGPYDYETGTTLAPDTVLGARKLGIENMAAACPQGVGVMIDFERHFGREHRPVGYDELMRVLEKDEVEVKAGDFVCIHTGFAQMLVDYDGKPDPDVIHNVCAALDGRDGRVLRWITDTGLAALIADNLAVEFLHDKPRDNCCSAKLPIHEHCLFRLGVNLGELWFLSPLADWLSKNGRNRFLLTAPPLRFPGAVGSPLTPIATV